MKKFQAGVSTIALVIALVVVGVLLLIPMVSYIGAYNKGNTLEQTLKATKENNENILAQYGQKVQEAAQVTDMQRDDLVKITTAAIQGRYGDSGSRASVQFLREQNPALDSKIYVKIQQIVEAGREEFKVNQTRLVDTKRAYETELGSFWGGMWLRIAGYPKINLDDFKIVSTERAQDAFKKGKEDGPLKLRPDAK